MSSIYLCPIHLYPSAHQISKESSLAGALGNQSDRHPYRPSSFHEEEQPPRSPEPVRASDTQRRNAVYFTAGRRADYSHPGRQMKILNQNPNGNNPISGNTIRYQWLGRYTPGVALSEAAYGQGMMSKDSAVLDHLIVRGEDGHVHPGKEVMKLSIPWPGSEKHRINLIDELSQRRVTIRELAMVVASSFKRLYQKLELNGSSGIIMGDCKVRIKFKQLRLLQIYSNDDGRTWHPEIGICED